MNTNTHRILSLALLACLVAAPALAGSESSGMDARIVTPRISGVVNINTAGPAQLALLPRVGPAVAERIVEFREKNGRYQRVEEILNVRGIGEKTFEQLKPYLRVTGESTIKELTDQES